MMDQSWTNFCKMSIVSFMAFPETASGQGPIIESIARIAEDDFFDSIEVAAIPDAATRAEVRRIIEVSQLQLSYCAHPTILSQKLNLNSLDEGERQKALQVMFGLIDQAAETGALNFVFLSGKDPGDAARPQAMEILVDSIGQICASCERSGLKTVLEIFDRAVDKKALVGPVRDALTVSQAVHKDHPGFGLLYDLSHMPLCDEVPGDMAVIRDHLVHIHVGNCVKAAGRPLYGDLHPYFGFPGGVNGPHELADFIRALFDIGYLSETKDPKPCVGFEVKPQGPGQTPELIIANARRTWKQAWAMA